MTTISFDDVMKIRPQANPDDVRALIVECRTIDQVIQYLDDEKYQFKKTSKNEKPVNNQYNQKRNPKPRNYKPNDQVSKPVVNQPTKPVQVNQPPPPPSSVKSTPWSNLVINNDNQKKEEPVKVVEKKEEPVVEQKPAPKVQELVQVVEQKNIPKKPEPKEVEAPKVVPEEPKPVVVEVKPEIPVKKEEIPYESQKSKNFKTTLRIPKNLSQIKYEKNRFGQFAGERKNQTIQQPIIAEVTKVETPKPQPVKEVETKQPETIKPVEVKQPEPVKPVEVKQPEPVKPVEVKQPEPALPKQTQLPPNPHQTQVPPYYPFMGYPFPVPPQGQFPMPPQGQFPMPPQGQYPMPPQGQFPQAQYPPNAGPMPYPPYMTPMGMPYMNQNPEFMQMFNAFASWYTQNGYNYPGQQPGRGQ